MAAENVNSNKLNQQTFQTKLQSEVRDIRCTEMLSVVSLYSLRALLQPKQTENSAVFSLSFSSAGKGHFLTGIF